MTINELDFSHSLYWIQIHDLPPDYLNVRNAKQIGDRLEDILAVEDPMEGNCLLKSYLRVRVNINISVSLSTRFWVPRKDKSSVRASLKYEKLKDYCYNYGRLGHDKKNMHISKSYGPLESL